MRATVRALRDGKPCQLVQKTTTNGVPCCVNCTHPIPKRFRESWRQRRSLFCKNQCAIDWAQWAAGEVYPEPLTSEPASSKSGAGRG